MKEVNLTVVILINVAITILYSFPMITLYKIPFTAFQRNIFTIAPILALTVCYFVLLYELKLYEKINQYDIKLATKIKLLFLYIYLQILLQFNTLFQYAGRNTEEIEKLHGKKIEPCFGFMNVSYIMHMVVVFGILAYFSC
tara:strand:- start:110 stop:532 length:423 start_codon:yes stop_codon:yes gene_type:complete